MTARHPHPECGPVNGTGALARVLERAGARVMHPERPAPGFEAEALIRRFDPELDRYLDALESGIERDGRFEREAYAAGDSRGFCVSCGWRMPAGADPDYFYCRKCSHVNELAADGTMGAFRAKPFSAEVEEANARVQRPNGRRR